MNHLFFTIFTIAVVTNFIACSVDASSNPPSSDEKKTTITTSQTQNDDSVIDARDGQVYKTTTIGTQTWMSQNLNYETINSFCYNKDPANCSKYGRLYTWAAAVGQPEDSCGYGKLCVFAEKVQGVCPPNWHIPSLAEFEMMFSTIGEPTSTAKKLKNSSGWSYNGNGSDNYGFSVLPAGYRYVNGHFLDEGAATFLWCSETDGNYYACSMNLIFSNDYVTISFESKSDGFSVRCVKD